jgi:hypothetical protein
LKSKTLKLIRELLTKEKETICINSNAAKQVLSFSESVLHDTDVLSKDHAVALILACLSSNAKDLLDDKAALSSLIITLANSSNGNKKVRYHTFNCFQVQEKYERIVA